ncbi:hypothetical protein NQZ68_038671 [Dissostichus eleginoides]|uniref:Interleukin-17F n=1 Tax=Dissostichus eleginoides TaxID=100907 RepID=A0AAD9F6H6_DISEL|nr:hypothetical protein NQZ68_038671 [Dissostichus eleginoides]KAK1890782.1 Interleukin-17F [Dissostichus eleginoides]
MTSSVSLQTISIGLLLIFNTFISTFAGGDLKPKLKCMSVNDVNQTAERFLVHNRSNLRFNENSLQNRSLSPWVYTVTRDDNRFPHEIPFAKCLYKGCFINQREDMSYNSVLVHVQLTIMKKTPCKRHPDRYRVNRDSIIVPVACTCAVPSYTK